mmetsp:Transcript_2134/g.3309  ORF Transcript_2134/g.3309 Transcript_2134/m.3309 type:complete len:91 (+) Transcript_2134:87-359(+)
MGATHALVALSSLLTTVNFLWATQPKGWLIRFMDREPIVFFSCVIGGFGLSLPVIVPPIRKSLGLSTSQYDGFTPIEQDSYVSSFSNQKK